MLVEPMDTTLLCLCRTEEFSQLLSKRIKSVCAYEPFGGRIMLRTGVSQLKRKRKVSAGGDKSGTKTRQHGIERRAFIITSTGREGANSVPRVQMLFSRVRTLLDAHSSVRCFVMPLNTASLSLLRIRSILSIQQRRHHIMASSPSLGVPCGSVETYRRKCRTNIFSGS